jgi:hypothetical protein
MLARPRAGLQQPNRRSKHVHQDDVRVRSRLTVAELLPETI